MINYDLPISVCIDGVEHPIRKKGDYRVIFDVIEVLDDIELTENQRWQCAIIIFYEDYQNISNLRVAAEEMMKFINNGENETDSAPSIKTMDWAKDFSIMAPPINRNLGYDIRMPDKYTHWWTFLGGYMEIGESTFSTVISIRKKKRKGQKLDKAEQEFYNANQKMIDLPIKLTQEEQALLNSDW